MIPPIATVIIPNYNGVRFLPRLRESLLRQIDPRWTAIVVDDVSTDGSAAYLQAQWPQAKLIRNRRNLGFAASCNIGMRLAATPFVVLLNNDTHVDPAWLAEGLKPFEQPEIAAVASLVLLARSPHCIDTAGDVYSVVGGALKRAHLLSTDTLSSLSERVFSASGVSAFYRRDAIASVGFLDESFESYYEDVDLGFRLAWAGYSTVFAPKSICHHHLSSSYGPKSWRYHFNSARNAEIVWWSYMPARLRRQHLLGHCCFLLLQAANKFRQGAIAPYLAGKWEVLRRVGRIREKRRRLREFAKVSDREIERLLVPDWWRLHVGGGLRRAHAAEPPGPVENSIEGGVT